ncbi:hypothetical protein NQ317_015348 [Molorchus minor]|uniref:Uncharacterized protein n=1 Tax=Molorchus minor TaxID=1323400 RepID=A0ABQ9ISE9_9CUCU|nr:hypothetical protein NQ317_015348 [Molorchus minor]
MASSKAVVRECVEMVVLLKKELKIIVNLNKTRKKRQFWVRQWILRRNRLGASETVERANIRG